jgi:formamidopyrimidine-DNA glycosylase
MPELPEVETTLRALRVVGRTILSVRGVDYLPTIAPWGLEAFQEALRGRRVEQARRRGKYLLFLLDRSLALAIHLRMSGRLLQLPGRTDPDPHTRLILELDDGSSLVLRDPRKFARAGLLQEPELQALEAALGPEPLDLCRNPVAWKARLLAHPRRRLKALLMDQRFVAGVGNIYADEALHRAHLHPLRRVGTLSDTEAIRLGEALGAVLREAIAAEGTTLEDGAYRFGDGQSGRFALRLRVYRRAGKLCTACGTPIARILVSARSSYFCPKCQPLL